MNTVMDDNKMLTLASNERIPLTPSMRLLLEINHMNHCSPATVSRGGVIFVNADDVGWKPVVDSWIERLEVIDAGQGGLQKPKSLLTPSDFPCLQSRM
jgi:dynein heavy chain